MQPSPPIQPAVPPVQIPAVFTTGNFAFASVSNRSGQDVFGSLYFADATGHQRIRLTHGTGPMIGRFHAGGEWYFPPVGTGFPQSDATTQEIDAWISGPPPNPAIPNTPQRGNGIIEYSAGHVNGKGRHVSRGTVAFPALLMNDITVIYNTIIALPDTGRLRQLMRKARAKMKLNTIEARAILSITPSAQRDSVKRFLKRTARRLKKRYQTAKLRFENQVESNNETLRNAILVNNLSAALRQP